MKGNLMLICFITISLLSVLPVSAKHEFFYRANGKLEKYEDTWSAELIDGSWKIKIKEVDSGPEVEFEAFYRELNINEPIENSPTGTIDTFKLTLVDYNQVQIIDDVCIITGATIHVSKKWWNINTGKPEPVEWYWYSDFVHKIEINKSGILIDLEPTLGQNWDISGPTLSIHYE